MQYIAGALGLCTHCALRKLMAHAEQEREKIAKEAAASAVAAMQSELQRANEFGEECAQRIATLEVSLKGIQL